MRFQACGVIVAAQAFIISKGAHTRSFLQPDAASRLFHQVAAKWEEEATIALKDSKADAEQLSHVRTACTKVANAFVAAVNGDRSKAVEYMDNVCYKSDDDICKEFGRRLADQVEASGGNEGDMASFCQAFWYGPLKNKAAGKPINSPADQDSSSPLKALPHYTQSASKLSGRGPSKMNSKEQIHEAATKIAADGVVRKPQTHNHSRVHTAEKKLAKTVPKKDKDAENRAMNATAAALKAAQAAFSAKKPMKGDTKTKDLKTRAASTKSKKVAAKKPKALVTSGSTTGSMVTDADLENAEHAAELQAQKAATAAAAAAKAAAEDAATASADSDLSADALSATKGNRDAELEKAAQEAEVQSQRTAKAAVTAKEAAAEEAKVAQAALQH